MALPVLGLVAKFIIANGTRAAAKKYGPKAIEKATKQIKARNKAINKNVDKLKQKGDDYPPRFTAKERARGAEVQRAKALERRLKAEQPKSRFDEEGLPLDEVPLKFSKGGGVYGSRKKAMVKTELNIYTYFLTGIAHFLNIKYVIF